MATIDDKVVAMSFESSKFEEGVNKTISALDKLKAKLNFPNAGKGLEDVSAAAKRVDLSHIGAGVDAVSHKLGALRLAGVAVMANLASQAVAMGARVVKSFTIDPVVAGFHNYETQINAVQTILANTGLKGKAGISQVNASLAELNKYANQTIYNFSEMTRNIGTFTAAGVDLKTATSSIKGIANLAALSGSTSEQASTAMYQLSQAIAAGQVKLQDWNSVVNAGIGGKVFQTALARTGQAMGTLKDGAVKMVGPMKTLQINGESFRNAISAKKGNSWLTSDVLTTTLKQFTGDMSKAQLAAIGFNASQIKSIQAQGKTASAAATNIKTFTQLQQALKEEVATAWAAIFKTIFGNLGDATHLFSAVHIAAENALTIPIYNLNRLLQGWAKLGGRKALIDGLKNSFHALGDVMAPIKAAFHDIFPPATAKGLADATKRFDEFTKKLKPSPQTVENLRRTFRGLFAVLDIGKQVVSGIFSVIGKLLGVVGHGSGGILSFTAKIGDFLTHIDKMLRQGDSIQKFFNLLAQAILVPIHAIEAFGRAVTNSTQNIHPFQHILDGVSAAFARLTGQAGKSGNVIKPITESIGKTFSSLGQVITNSLSNLNFNDAATAIGVGFLGALTLMFKKFAQGGFDSAIFSGLFKNISGSFGGLAFALKGVGGAFNGVSQVMKGLTGNLQAMQQKTKAEALKEIAIAIALIAASAVALSLVDPAKLNSALGSLTIMFGQLLASMAILDKIGKSGGFIRLPIIAGSMILLATAIDILTIAVLGLSRLSWEQLAKGLGAVGVLLASISVTAKPLGANSAGLIRAGAGIAAIGIALNILALAVRQFGSMDISTLGKGLGSVAVALAGIGAASRLFPAGMISMGAGLILVAGALFLLEKSVTQFGNLKMDVIGKGILGIAGALLAIGVAMRVMPKGMIAQALALGVVALALQGIAKAVGTFGGMSIDQIAKGLGTLAASLLILGIAMAAMSEVGAGAAALIVAAGAIAILAPAIKSLGEMSWIGIIKSMVALAAAFTILGIAGALLTPVAPSLLALGAALLLIGAGMALAGAGVALVGVGLSAIAVAGPVAVGILIKAMESLAEAIPTVAKNLVNGLLSIVQNVAETAPKFVAAIIKIVEALASAIPPLLPKLGVAFLAIINTVLKVIVAAFPKITEAGFQMLLALLQGISTHITEVTNQVANIVTKFLLALANKLPQIVGAGATIIIKLLQGIANSIGRIASAATDIMVALVRGIAGNEARLVRAAADAMSKFIKAITSSASKLLSAGTQLVVSLLSGISKSASRITTAGVAAATRFVNAILNGTLKMVNVGAQAVVKFLNGVADAINKYERQVIDAGVRIGEAIVNGMIQGVGNIGQKLLDKVGHLISSLPAKGLKLLGINSPSKVFVEIGQSIVEGLHLGISDHKDAITASESMANGVINAVKDIFQISSPSKVMAQIGQDVNRGFVQGLNGGADQIKGAFNKLNDEVKQALDQTHALIISTQKKIDNEQKKKKPDTKQISEWRSEIIQAKKDVDNLTHGHTALGKSFDKEKVKLIELQGEYAKMKKRVDDATTSLKNAIQARDDFASTTTQNAIVLPDIVSIDANGDPIDPAKQVQNYGDQLNATGDNVGQFANDLAKLKSLGIDDTTYRHLLDIGPAADQFVQTLITLGPDAIQNINNLDTKLAGAAQTLGTNAGTVLYQAGVDSAQNLLKGLTDGIDGKTPDGKTPLAALTKSIDDLITQIVHQVRKKLGIKSPSTVFAEIGTFAVQGLANGLTDTAGIVTDAASTVADNAVSAMQNSFSKIADAVNTHIDANPTITPVLDLSQVQDTAKGLPDLLNMPITASSAHAAAILAAQTNGAGSSAVGADSSVIKFEQNNYSPESLTAIEIYRLTKNQLSQAKAVLATAP